MPDEPSNPQESRYLTPEGHLTPEGLAELERQRKEAAEYYRLHRRKPKGKESDGQGR